MNHNYQKTRHEIVRLLSEDHKEQETIDREIQAQMERHAASQYHDHQMSEVYTMLTPVNPSHPTGKSDL